MNQLSLTKKGSLGRVWLAAHWDQKVGKQLVLQTSIPAAIDAIIAPETKLSLRITGHLLLGIVKLFARKSY
jgi:cohesin complex subunit SCC1